MPRTETNSRTAEPGRRAGLPARTAAPLAAGFIALALTACMLFQSLRLKSDRLFSETFTFSETDVLGFRDSFFRRGWMELPPGFWDVSGALGGKRRRALGLEPGGNAMLGYCFLFDPGEKVSVTLHARNDDVIRTKAVLESPGSSARALPLPSGTDAHPFVMETLDLTSYLQDVHYFHLTIHSTRAKEDGERRVLPAVTNVDFQFRSREFPRVNFISCAFFSVLCFLVWWAALGFVLPAAAGTCLVLLRFLRKGRKEMAVGFLCAVVAAWFVFQPQHLPKESRGVSGGLQFLRSWSGAKLHDDLWALGNARLLALRRFHTEDLFFRSRVRPGFMALALPLQTGLPHHLAIVSYTPSDSYRRLFYIFDRTGFFWNRRICPEMSLLGLFAAMAGLALAGRLAFALDAGRGAFWRAAAAVALAAWFWARALETPLVSVITLSTTWTIQLAAMLAFVEAVRVPGRKSRWLLAGGLAGIAILFKESALTFLLTAALFQAYCCWTAESGPRRDIVVGSAVYWLTASLLPLTYFGLVLDGGFAEVVRNFHEHVESRSILEQYEERGIRGAVRALWTVFGVGLLPALAGLLFRIRRGRSASCAAVFFFFWLAGCSIVFALPYLYPRFLVDMIPAMAWFAADGLWVVAFRPARFLFHHGRKKLADSCENP